MRFLVENGAYNLDNIGDTAMLRVTVNRLLARWPQARVDVLTNEPDLVREHLPGATPLLAGPWFRMPILPLPLRFERSRVVRKIRWWERHLDRIAPRLATAGRSRYAHRHEPQWEESTRQFFEAIASADAVVCCGGGLINDWFFEHARRILATLCAAQGLGKPTAMFGLGLGPTDLKHVRRRAAPVLRRLDVLGLREGDLGPRIARQLGVRARIIRVTGDDAIELAVDRPVCPERTALGVNVRLAPHSQVPESILPTVGNALRRAAGRLGAPIVALPVRSVRNRVNDVDAVARLVGAELIDRSQASAIFDPDQLIDAAGRCRVVVTGAYHSAVFALAQGVPVIGLAQSGYYLSKLGGVAAQFGAAPGITVLHYDEPELGRRLEEAIERAWHVAPEVNDTLRRAAADQVRKSRNAYEDLFRRVEDRARRKHS